MTSSHEGRGGPQSLNGMTRGEEARAQHSALKVTENRNPQNPRALRLSSKSSLHTDPNENKMAMPL